MGIAMMPRGEQAAMIIVAVERDDHGDDGDGSERDVVVPGLLWMLVG